MGRTDYRQLTIDKLKERINNKQDKLRDNSFIEKIVCYWACNDQINDPGNKVAAEAWQEHFLSKKKQDKIKKKHRKNKNDREILIIINFYKTRERTETS